MAFFSTFHTAEVETTKVSSTFVVNHETFLSLSHVTFVIYSTLFLRMLFQLEL